MARPTAFCETCETTVYIDMVHSCYDAKAVRLLVERERRVVEAAVAAAPALDRMALEEAHFGGQVDDTVLALLEALRDLTITPGRQP